MKNIFIVIILTSCLFSCKSGTKTDEKAATTAENIATLTDAQIKNAGIVTGKIEQQNISSTIKVNGKIDVPPQNLVSISVPMGGYLKSTNLLEGMYIRKGQVLGIVEDKQYIQLQEDYLMAKAKISYEEILDFFFRIHDPTTEDRQGNDRGDSYRSAIFYHDEKQRASAQKMINIVNESKAWPNDVVTQLVPAQQFWVAETEHQDYLERIPNGYTCHFIRKMPSFLKK